MAPRSFWKGYLKLSLVTCPVEMTPVVSEGQKVRFHTLNRATGHRIQSRYVDAVTGKEVETENQVKGYPRGEDDYVMLEDEELDEVALESTRTIDIAEFVPRESIDWIWYDVPHFLKPGDDVAQEAFSVIREAMRATDTVGISRVVLYRRERAVMVEPRGKGMILWTLRYGDEVRDEGEYFGDLTATADPKMLKMVSSLIAERQQDWSPEMVGDPVQDELLKLIKSKQRGAKRKAKAKAALALEPDAPSNVIDLMAALKKSLEEKSGAKRK